MKHNKFFVPMFVGVLLLTSCGLGDAVTKEVFASQISNLSSTVYSSVKLKGKLTTRYMEVETDIPLDFSYVYSDGAYIPDTTEQNDVQIFLAKTLGPTLINDFARSENGNNQAYYTKGDAGFAMTFTLGNSDEDVTKASGEYKYEYNSNGFYTTAYEKETFINNGLSYTSVLNATFSWVI